MQLKKWNINDEVSQTIIEQNENMVELENAFKVAELDNLIINGDFSDGTNGLGDNIGFRLETKDNILNAIVTNTSPGSRIGLTKENYNETDKYYISVKVKSKLSQNISLSLGGYGFQVIKMNVANEFTDINGIASPTRDLQGGRLFIYLSTSLYELNDVINVKEPISINLTQTFGVGNEPTKEEMDEIINITGWFDNEYALSNKEMFIALLNMIRKNTMAITALGGTQ